MIKEDKFEFKENQLWYKGVKLDLSSEMIQDLHHNTISEKTAEKAIKESYEKNLRIHRENLLKTILNDKAITK